MCLIRLAKISGDGHLSPSLYPVTKIVALDLSLVLVFLGLVSPLWSSDFFPSPHKPFYVVGFTVVPSGALSGVSTDLSPRLLSFMEKPSSFTERPSSFTERPSSFMERPLPSSSLFKERPSPSFLFFMKTVSQSSAFMAFIAQFVRSSPLASEHVAAPSVLDQVLSIDFMSIIFNSSLKNLLVIIYGFNLLSYCFQAVYFNCVYVSNIRQVISLAKSFGFVWML